MALKQEEEDGGDDDFHFRGRAATQLTSLYLIWVLDT
jgi:hypothetical protein